MSQTVKNVVFWLVIMLSAFLLWQVVKSGGGDQRTPETSYSEFLSQAEGGNVTKVTISRTRITGMYRDGRPFQVVAPTSQEGMLQTLHHNNVEIWFSDTATGDWPTWLMNLAPLILLAALWFFMIRQIKQRREIKEQINKPL